MAETFDIRPVAGKRDATMFVRVPRLLYRGMPGWVAPLDMERAENFNPKKNPFFRHAEVAFWLAWRGEEPVGRIAASIDQLHIDRYADATGHFGCLDCVDDPALVSGLLRTAEAWLRERGMKRVTGPFNLSINAESGLVTSGFTHRPMFMTPWNPPYLPPHVDAAGYAVAADTMDYDFDVTQPVSAIGSGMLARSELASRVTTRGIRMGQLKADVRIALGLFNDAWANNWGFVPFTDAEIEHAASAMRPVLREVSATFVEIDGVAHAFALGIPNLLEWVDRFDGRLLPFNWVPFAWNVIRARPNAVRIPLMGVSSTYQKSPLGAGLAMMAIEGLHRSGKKRGTRRAELGWVLEQNRPMRRIIERLGGKVSKTYRIYERALA